MQMKEIPTLIHYVIRTIEIYDFTDLFVNVVVLCKIIIMSQFLHILRINLQKINVGFLFPTFIFNTSKDTFQEV